MRRGILKGGTRSPSSYRIADHEERTVIWLGLQQTLLPFVSLVARATKTLASSAVYGQHVEDIRYVHFCRHEWTGLGRVMASQVFEYVAVEVSLM